MADAIIQKTAPESAQARKARPNFGISFLANCTKFLRDEKNQLNVKAINGLLFLFIGLLAVFYGQLVIGSLHTMKTIDLESGFSGNDTVASISSTEKGVLQPAPYYVEKVQKRNIFKMGPKTASDNSDVISSKAAEATQNLKLVGISWSAQPDAMIEDTKAAKTYFVKKGQMVGDLKVEAVYRDRVMLRFGAETIELR